jgi:hypothetical protein
MRETQQVRTAEIRDTPEVLERLEADGVVTIPGYLDGGTVAQAVRECSLLFGQTPAWAHHEEYSLGQSVRMELTDVDEVEFPAIASVFTRPELAAVVHGFFGDGFIFSRTVYAILDVVGSTTHVQQLHYDKMRHLKSFIYLSDVTQATGPFHCVPGSHLQTREAQRENRLRRIVPTDSDVRRLPAGLANCTIPVLGEAGTLILFDSDIVHNAGIVTDGSRLAIRSLSFGAYRADTWYRKDGTIELPP